MAPKSPPPPEPDLTPAVRRWKENLARGSPSTGGQWYRALVRFAQATGKTPEQLPTLNPESLRDLFMDYVASEEKRGSKGSYTKFTLNVVRNWLKFNGATPPAGVKVRSADLTFEETALSPDQLRAALGAAGLREKVAILLMGTAGLRPEVLGNYLGTDGLTLGDLPELIIDGKGARFERIPSPILVRQELSKGNHRYVTFVGDEAGSAIVDLLNARAAAGEKLKPETALFPVERLQLATHGFVCANRVGDSIRRTFRRAGLTNRPYVLRTTAASRFAECENRGLVAHSYWQHWLGHAGDMSARYSLNRGKIPASLLEEMRGSFERCLPTLSTSSLRRDLEDRDLENKKLLLMVAGYTKDQVEKMDPRTMSPEDLYTAIENGPAKGAPAGPKQQVIPEAELPRYLADGWVARMPVNGSKFVVERAG